MTTEEIIQDSYFYHWILEKGETAGIEKGIEKGIERGIEKGEKQGISSLLSQQLMDKFGPLPPWAQDRLTAADVEMLRVWARRVLFSTTLEGCLNGDDQTR